MSQEEQVLVGEEVDKNEVTIAAVNVDTAIIAPDSHVEPEMEVAIVTKGCGGGVGDQVLAEEMDKNVAVASTNVDNKNFMDVFNSATAAIPHPYCIHKGLGTPLLRLPGQKEEGLRYCAFCSRQIPPAEVKLCPSCNRRAYCSERCQRLDWAPNGKGQGHEGWCGLQVCEEFLDWELVNIMKRGVGICAKKMIPALTRIIVEGFNRSPSLGLEGTRRAKYANHECDANAAVLCKLDDEGRKVLILYSRRDILSGEEITINYTSFNEITPSLGSNLGSVLDTHDHLLEKEHHITCPLTCFCQDKEVLTQISVNLELFSLKMAEKNPQQKLAICMKLLAGLAAVRASPLESTKLLLQAIPLALRLKKPHLLEKYVGQVRQFCENVYDPRPQRVIQYQQTTRGNGGGATEEIELALGELASKKVGDSHEDQLDDDLLGEVTVQADLFENLPLISYGVLSRLFNFLGVEDVANCVQVCQSWHKEFNFLRKKKCLVDINLYDKETEGDKYLEAVEGGMQCHENIKVKLAYRVIQETSSADANGEELAKKFVRFAEKLGPKVKCLHLLVEKVFLNAHIYRPLNNKLHTVVTPPNPENASRATLCLRTWTNWTWT